MTTCVADVIRSIIPMLYYAVEDDKYKSVIGLVFYKHISILH